MTAPAMTDDVIVAEPREGGQREQHPTGAHIGVCVDVINLGPRLKQFPGKAAYVQTQIAFVFQTGLKDTDGKLFTITKEVGLSFGPKANFPKFIGTWRGEPISAAEEKDIEKNGFKRAPFLGKPAQLSLVGKTAKNGNTYTNIDTVTPLMAQMTSFIPVLPAYTRADFWQARITEYADEVAEFRRKQGVANAATARGAVAQAPSAPLSDADAVAKMQASEQAAQDSDLPPF